jgi:hypothetical protein
MDQTPNTTKAGARISNGLFIAMAVVVGLIGLASGVYWGRHSGSTVSGDAESRHGSETGRAVDELAVTLADEIKARRALSMRIAALESEIAQLASPVTGDGTSRPEDSDDSKITEAGAPRSNTTVDKSTRGFNDEALISAGIDPLEVERLHAIWADQELESAELADRALREGYFFSARHGEEVAQLERELREALPDEDYDRYLFARGESNRLRAREVLPGSAASEAGLRQGDMILRYGDVRVFDPGTLLFTSSQGELGRSVEVEILRNDRRKTVYISRGPLGVIIEPTRGEPLPE